MEITIINYTEQSPLKTKQTEVNSNLSAADFHRHRSQRPQAWVNRSAMGSPKTWLCIDHYCAIITLNMLSLSLSSSLSFLLKPWLLHNNAFRKHTVCVRKRIGEGITADSLWVLTESSLADSQWVLTESSLTDSHGCADASIAGWFTRMCWRSHRWLFSFTINGRTSCTAGLNWGSIPSLRSHSASQSNHLSQMFPESVPYTSVSKGYINTPQNVKRYHTTYVCEWNTRPHGC